LAKASQKCGAFLFTLSMSRTIYYLHAMESFEVEVDIKKYNISPLEDETFAVKSDDGLEFIIIPDLIDSGVIWNIIKGKASNELIQSIGEAIEDFEE
jgi:hypothetical protein